MIGNGLKILIVDDDADDIFLVKELIQEEFVDQLEQVDFADNYEDALQKIAGTSYHVCLMDLRLGARNGIELMGEFRETGYSNPVILLTGQGDQAQAVEAMKAGANDYLIKSKLSVEVLGHAIRQAVKMQMESEQRRKTEETLRIHENYLQALAKANHALLTRREHFGAIEDALSIMAKATQSDYVYILQNKVDGSNIPQCCKYFSWSRKVSFSSAPKVEPVGYSYNQLGIFDVLSKIKNGHTVNIVLDKLTKPACDLFETDKIRSLLMIPIILDEVFWGVAAFGDFHPTRHWDESEKSVLETLTAGIGGKIRRDKDDETFRKIVEGTSGRVGSDFFSSLVRQLAETLHVHAAFISEFLTGQEMECRTLACWQGGKVLPNFVYSVENTPCEDSFAGMMSYHPDNIQELYPKDKFLSDMKVKSYASIPCFDSGSKVVGHLVIMDIKPMTHKERTLSLLKLFGSRAGAELERKRAEEIIKNLAYHDALTGLPNRMLLSDRLTMGLAHSQRNNVSLAVLYLDFDGFKKINDTLGHDAGDQLLREVAARLKSCLRKQDTVARLGGDEFILLLPEIHSPDDAARLADKLLEVGRTPVVIDGKELQITFSIGISLYPGDGEDAKLLIQYADEALYAAKNAGKNCYHFYNNLTAKK